AAVGIGGAANTPCSKACAARKTVASSPCASNSTLCSVLSRRLQRPVRCRLELRRLLYRGMCADKILASEQLLHDLDRQEVRIEGELAVVRGHGLEFAAHELPDVDARGALPRAGRPRDFTRRRPRHNRSLPTALEGSALRGRKDETRGALDGHHVRVARLAI